MVAWNVNGPLEKGSRVGQEGIKKKLRWALVVINAVGGVLWLLAAFGIVRGREGTNYLYLAVGVVSLAASAVWLLSQRSS